MAETILSEDKLMKWLDINPWRVTDLLLAGMPSLRMTRELRFYSKQRVTEWILERGIKLTGNWVATEGATEG